MSDQRGNATPEDEIPDIDDSLEVDTGLGELLNTGCVIEDARELYRLSRRPGCGEGERWATATPAHLTLALALMVEGLAEAHRAELDALTRRVKRLEEQAASHDAHVDLEARVAAMEKGEAREVGRKEKHEEEVRRAYNRGHADGEEVGALRAEES